MDSGYREGGLSTDHCGLLLRILLDSGDAPAGEVHEDRLIRWMAVVPVFGVVALGVPLEHLAETRDRRDGHGIDRSHGTKL
jgi:hypothetical protein